MFCCIFLSALLLAFLQYTWNSSALCPALSIRNVGVNELTGAHFLLSLVMRCSSLFRVGFFFFGHTIAKIKYAFLFIERKLLYY